MEESSLRVEAKANAIRCRRAMWGGQPCTPRGGCPFDRKSPQRPSELHCEDVTPEMWAETLTKKEAKHEAEV